jgi:hypothetical protein
MQHRNIHKIFFPLVIILLSAGNSLYSQNAEIKATRQSSLEAYNSGDFEKAYIEFTGLLETYPKDPLYKYYAGVCLIKISREPEKALLYLQQAQQGSAVVRTVPADVVFWQGRAQQLCGQFAEAENSYREFIVLEGKKGTRQYGVQDLIKQCNDNKGLLNRNDFSEAIKIENKPVVIETENIVKVVADTTNEKIIAKRELLPQDYDGILSEALEYQSIADSLMRITADPDNLNQNMDLSKKTELRRRITETEALAADYQKRADQKFEEAQLAMIKVEFAAEKTGIELPTRKVDTLIVIKEEAVIRKSEDSNIIRRDSSGIKIQGSVREKGIKESVKENEKDSDIGNDKKTEIVSPAKKPEMVYSVFEVDPKKVYKADEKIPVDAAIPEGLIYRIQVAVFRNPVSPTYFKGISPVYGFKVIGTDKTGYYAGMFRKHSDAAKALTRVKQTGFKDAFIVSSFRGKAVSADRAALLEKEWGNKFLKDPAVHVEEVADTIPPTLSFRIEIYRESKPAKDEIIDTYKRLAGSRGFDTYKLEDGTYIYLIGHFITYESAEEYASLLARNGLRDAKVTAWLGLKEIPVDTARQLFEKLE